MLLNQKSLSKKNISNQLTINAYEIDVDQINSPTITILSNDIAVNTSNIATNTAIAIAVAIAGLIINAMMLLTRMMRMIVSVLVYGDSVPLVLLGY